LAQKHYHEQTTTKLRGILNQNLSLDFLQSGRSLLPCPGALFLPAPVPVVGIKGFTTVQADVTAKSHFCHANHAKRVAGRVTDVRDQMSDIPS